MKKRKFLSFLALAVSSFGLIAGVNAEPVDCDGKEIASTGDVCYDDLQEALTNAQVGSTVYLKQSVNVDSGQYIKIDKNLTFDLGSFELSFTGTTPVFGLWVNDATATIKNGKISQKVAGNRDSNITPVALYMMGSSDVALEDIEIVDDSYTAVIMRPDNSLNSVSETLTVKSTAMIKSGNGHAISGIESGNKTINVYGTLVAGGGYAAVNGAWDAKAPVDINIYKGANVTGGVLQMSGGKTVIEGTVTNSNSSAVVITKGSLEVKEGAVITSTAPADQEWQATNNYSVYDDRAAIFAEPTGDVSITIKGGEITSTNSYGISAPATNDDNTRLTISVEKGTFESAKGGINIYEAEPREAFVEPGVTFTVKGEPDKNVLKYTNDLNISESGVVGKVYTITVENTENGEVKVNKDAAVGETVKVEAIANAGYKVGSIIVTYKDGEEVKTVPVAADGSFEMPAFDVTVTVTFVKNNNPENGGEDNKEIVVDKEIKGDENVTLSENASDILKDTLANTEDETLKELIKNNDVTIELETTKITKDSLTKEELAKFEEVIKGATITEFFDLDIVIKAVGQMDHYLTELNKPITLTVDLPELPEVKDGYVRKYYILREHDGVIEKLDATLSEDGKSLLFASDKFSRFAIAYEDEVKADETENKTPSTLDTIEASIAICSLSLCAIGVASKKFIKNL